jgi:hypothetical protein
MPVPDNGIMCDTEGSRMLLACQALAADADAGSTSRWQRQRL